MLKKSLFSFFYLFVHCTHFLCFQLFNDQFSMIYDALQLHLYTYIIHLYIYIYIINEKKRSFFKPSVTTTESDRIFLFFFFFREKATYSTTNFSSPLFFLPSKIFVGRRENATENAALLPGRKRKKEKEKKKKKESVMIG